MRSYSAEEEVMGTGFLMNSTRVPRVIHVTTIGITSYRALLAQCQLFREKGMEIGFVFSPSPEKNLLQSLRFPVKEIYMDRNIKPLSDAKAILKMFHYFKAVKPDIVHTHTSKAGVVGRIAAKMAKVNYIVHTVHGFPFHQGMPKLKFFVYKQIEKSMARITDIMLSQSQEDIINARELGIKPRSGNLIHIGNGVNLDEFCPARYSLDRRQQIRESLAIKEYNPVITMIGRVNREKGYHDLVEALRQINDMPWQALFIGPDEGFLTNLKKQIDDAGLQQRILLLGQRSDISDLLAITDVYVLPSYREGLPRSLIEAQSMGIPCVATDIRGCREVILAGSTGYLIKPGDSRSLSEVLRKLLLDDRLRLKMGSAGRTRMQLYFSETEVARKVMAVYERLLGADNALEEQIFQ
ncbi:putative glycosyltransferase EpsD [Sporotomaculum syntrophicum]|uniref:Glycosyltransferase EpsD n=1 Tax=Sporotomaculum syntrophicum TaxID=182264 RepID=A0A9D3AYX7_9FIRM|nr:glycosyltransferase family 4 protein [Sporotomaculum syntrophicum]KAF1085946.1 putative glycosyltransferase EpsD [Sporotomaculum syntrophicum]